METKYKTMVSFVFLILLIFGLYFFTDWFSKVTGYVSGEDEKTILAQCLDFQESELYVEENCAQCAKQIGEFGSAIKFLEIVDCTEIKCEGLREIPAWYINGSVYYGYKTLNELEDISNCA